MNRQTWFGLMLAVAVAGGVWYVRKAITRPVGSPCSLNSDCRSGICLSDAVDYSGLNFNRRPSVCTDECESDADCPPSMACGAVSSGGTIWHGCVVR